MVDWIEEKRLFVEVGGDAWGEEGEDSGENSEDNEAYSGGMKDVADTHQRGDARTHHVSCES